MKHYIIIICLTCYFVGSLGQDACPPRNDTLTCLKPCSIDTLCKRQNRECRCDGDCGMSCLRKACPSLTATTNGKITYNPSDIRVTSVATYTCLDGYSVSGDNNSTCLADKTWSSEQNTSCLLNSAATICPRNESEINSQSWTCLKPCSRNSPCPVASRSCVCDGICGKSCIFTDRDDFCPAQSNDVSVTVSIIPEAETVKHGSAAKYDCGDGYTAQNGDIGRSCMGNGQWSGTELICIPDNHCGDPPAVEHSIYSVEKTYYLAGDTVTYSCTSGYYRTGMSLIQCQERTFTWTRNDDFECYPKSCGAPEDVDNARRVGYSFLFLNRVTFVCDLGYKIQGSINFRECQANQQWSHPIPVCISGGCPDPGIPEHATKQGNIYGYNYHVRFECEEDFVIEGIDVLTCQTTGMWSASLPTCNAHCVIPACPDNGSWEEINCGEMQTRQHGFALQYECHGDYFADNTVLICNNGEWSQPSPTCTSSLCFCENSGDFNYDCQEGAAIEDVVITCKNGKEIKGDYILVCTKGKLKGRARC